MRTIGEAQEGDGPSRDDRIAGILADWRARREAGESLDPEDVAAAHPELADELRAHFAALQILDFAVLEQMELEDEAKQRSGTHVGPYRIVRLVGRGGMGRVYLAEQEEPIRRRVALKVLGSRLDDERARARFDLEREALALMDHPYIAPVHDAGLAEDGTPYVVMAYVDGEPITAYCEERNLGLPERLELFAQVCEAVQHAHQKGVIHRDIKPGNVLVTEVDGKPAPRVIDFGLARSSGTSLDLESRLTMVDQVVGTPAYMSPEQAAGGPDVDARSDVYALGVLLYELLTGDVPWGRTTLTRRNLGVVLQRILDEEPLRPSTQITTARKAEVERPAPAGAVRERDVRGDLDWIVMRAMAKEPGRRYASAQEVADDVRRHLRNEPVEAGPPSAGYRLRKFVRRHRVPVAAAVALLLALTAGLIATWILYEEATDARYVAEEALKQESAAKREARATRGEAEAILDFMVVDLRNNLWPLGRMDLLGDVASRARVYYEARADEALSGEELRRYALALENVAEVFRAQGASEEALETYRTSLGAWGRMRVAGGSNELATVGEVTSLSQIGRLLNERGELEAARDAWEKAVLKANLVESAPADERWVDWQEVVAGSHTGLGMVLMRLGDPASALSAYERGLSIREAAVKRHPDDPVWSERLAISFERIGEAQDVLARPAVAVDVLRRATAIRRKASVGRPDDRARRDRLATVLVRLGSAQLRAGKTADALQSMGEAADLMRALVEHDPTNAMWKKNLVSALSGLAGATSSQGRVRGALALYEEAARHAEARANADPGDYHAQCNFHSLLSRQASMHADLGNADQALALESRSAKFFRQVAAEKPEDYNAVFAAAGALIRLGLAYKTRNRIDEALASMEEAYAPILGFAERRSDDDRALQNLALLLGHMNTILEMMTARGTPKPDAWSTLDARIEDTRQRLMRLSNPSLEARGALASLLLARGRSHGHRRDYASAVRELRSALRIRKELAELDPDNVYGRGDVGIAHSLLSVNLGDWGKHAEQLEHAREAVAVYRDILATKESVPSWMNQLDFALLAQGFAQSDLGDLDGARKTHSERIRILERLVKLDPANVDWKQRLKLAHADLAGVSRPESKEASK